jgi:hypothetical protein
VKAGQTEKIRLDRPGTIKAETLTGQELLRLDRPEVAKAEQARNS